VLPVNVQACHSVLALCGESYCTRLWCIWELYTVFAFAPVERAVARVKLQPVNNKGQASAVDVPLALSKFDLSNVRSYDPNEEGRIRKVICDCGELSFESHIRELGHALQDKACPRRAGASAHSSM
jgi:hypothetical protein